MTMWWFCSECGEAQDLFEGRFITAATPWCPKCDPDQTKDTMKRLCFNRKEFKAIKQKRESGVCAI